MNPVSRLASFLYDNRRKFFISGVFVGGCAAAYYYAKHKLHEFQERSMQDMLEGVRRQRYFENVRDTCDETILVLDKTLHKYLLNISKIDDKLELLQRNPDNKIEIWENLKIATFTHLIVLIYTEALLATVVRIQFGIIGGYTYQEKITDGIKLNESAQEKYLSLFINFFKNGLEHFYELVKIHVVKIVSKINLKDNFNVQKLQETMWSVQTLISNDNENLIKNLNKYLDVDVEINRTKSPVLKQAYLDTIDMLSNSEVISEINTAISLGFSFFIDQLVEFFPLDEFQLSHSMKSITTAKLIPIIYNLTCSYRHCEAPAIWINYLRSLDKLLILSANVYEAYC